MREQWREIEKVGKHLHGIKLLRGIEVDIIDDGTLDLPDEVLAELDWVVASVHYKLNQSSKDMTRRMVAAIRNPHVDVIGHPSGRLLTGREPSGFDLAEVLHAAREEGCALEVNSQAERLDLTDSACLAAKHAGSSWWSPATRIIRATSLCWSTELIRPGADGSSPATCSTPAPAAKLRQR